MLIPGLKLMQIIMIVVGVIVMIACTAIIFLKKKGIKFTNKSGWVYKVCAFFLCWAIGCTLCGIFLIPYFIQNVSA